MRDALRAYQRSLPRKSRALTSYGSHSQRAAAWGRGGSGCRPLPAWRQPTLPLLKTLNSDTERRTAEALHCHIAETLLKLCIAAESLLKKLVSAGLVSPVY